MAERGRPIGYWVKLVDRLLEEGLDAELARDGLTRRHWQVLNAVADGPADERSVARALAPFGTAADEPVGTDELTLLVSRAWVRHGPAGYELSTDGAEHVESLGARVRAFRGRTAQGITAEEYATTVSVLERMATNLGWSTPDAPPPPRSS